MHVIGREHDPRASARLEAALRTLGADLHAPLGWQARVLAEAPARARPWWRRRELAFTAGLAAAALLALAVWQPWRGVGGPMADAAPPQLAVLVEHRGDAVRGLAEGVLQGRASATSVRVGDVIRAAAQHGAGHRAIWIYRGRDELIAVCPGAACADTPAALTAALTVELVGTYTVVALWSARPIPAPAGTRDEALAAAARSGALHRVETITAN